MKTKTLVIHPEDPTTDFLKNIYQGMGFTEIRRNFNSIELKALISEHDRIIMLGHGFHLGLLDHFKIVIDDSYAPLLKEKELLGIWCFAKEFFVRNELTGFHTEMFISELPEAILFGVKTNTREIEQSNDHFAHAVRSNLFAPQCFERIYSSYDQLESHVARFNLKRLCFRHASGDFQGCEQVESNRLILKRLEYLYRRFI